LNSILPVPQEVRVGRGFFKALGKTICFGPDVPAREKQIFCSLFSCCDKGPSLKIPFAVAIKDPKQEIQESYLRRLRYVEFHGYCLIVNPSSLTLVANSKAGLFYGYQTLSQVVAKSGANRVVKAVEIIDYPLIEHRGIMIDVARQVESINYLKKLVTFMGEYKLNQLYLYLENKMRYYKHPEVAHPMAYNKTEMESLIREAAKHYVEIIPMPATFGHMESFLKHPSYSHLGEGESREVICPQNREAVKFVTDCLEELCCLFPGSHIHLSGDEVFHMGLCPKCRLIAERDGKARLYADYINRLCQVVHRHGKRPIIWADMVKSYPECLNLLSRDIILTDWQYGAMDGRREQTIKHWQRAGFDVAIAPAVLVDAVSTAPKEQIQRNVPYYHRYPGLWGSIGCIWEPRTQTLSVTHLPIASQANFSWNTWGTQPWSAMAFSSKSVYGANISRAYTNLSVIAFETRQRETKMAYYYPLDFVCRDLRIYASLKKPVWRENAVRQAVKGLYYLQRCKRQVKKNKEDLLDIEATGQLALLLAKAPLIIYDIAGVSRKKTIRKKDIETALKNLKELRTLYLRTLNLMHIAWNRTRKHGDANFDLWFSSPLGYQMRSIGEIEDVLKKALKGHSHGFEIGGRVVIQIEFRNLFDEPWIVRPHIYFSSDKICWQEIFFKSIPLWMRKEMRVNLMPINIEDANFIKIVPASYSCFPPNRDWTKAIKIALLRTLRVGDGLKDVVFDEEIQLLPEHGYTVRLIKADEEQLLYMLKKEIISGE